MTKFNPLRSNSAGVPTPKTTGTRTEQRIERVKYIAKRAVVKNAAGKVKVNPLRLNSGGQYRF